MKRATVIFLFAALLHMVTAAENYATDIDGMVRCVIDTDGDTIPWVQLRPLYCFAPMKFKNKRQEKFYWRTVRDVKKTLPYAKIIGKEYARIEVELRKYTTDKERRAYMNEYEKGLLRKYRPAMTQLSAKQGQMLMKLVDRECNITSYELIRLYRGKAAAGFWQCLARLFGNNLKEEYDGNDKDRIIERVIILVENGQL
ncbi:MAG TPA: DUF4294 domain-containing protein [Bacteroidales bacterium]|nr:DUF4294 domain-containing protein [Bacteroidales bacterium]